MNRTAAIFGNPMPASVQRKAEKAQSKYLRKFGDDRAADYPLSVSANPILGPSLGIENLTIGDAGTPIDSQKGILLGNIRMGYGHFRIAMAIASAANHLGYKPYWFDISSYQQTTGGKVISHLNDLYSLGSRLSQKSALFNRFYWEPLNSEGFKKLSFNANDQKVAELMTPIFRQLPKSMPFIGSHAWPAQAAVHAGMERVVNIIPDNWPMALHLAEGSIHTVQTPSSYMGYKALTGMDGKKSLKPMPDGSIVNVGHYVDHELLADLASDTAARMARIKQNRAKRLLLTIGGAGAQFDIYKAMLKALLPKLKNKQVVVYINVGDHQAVLDKLLAAIPELEALTTRYDNDWQATQAFASDALSNDSVSGVHAFSHQDIFAAVYATNLLMRSCDLLVTKPSELAFYPVPKLLIKRVGGHEAYGALRAAEVGDGTPECETESSILNMLQLLLDRGEMLEEMNRNIIKAQQAGVYDGAYQAVKLATHA